MSHARARVIQVQARPVLVPVAAWTTPALLRLSVYGIFAGAALLMLAAITGARSHHQAMQSVGRDAAPSIVAAQHIRSALADMDANAANALLSRDGAAEALRLFEARRQEAVGAILAAAENITYGDAERTPIQHLALGLGSYAAQVQQALDLQKSGDKRFLDAYRAAAQTLDEQLLPAAADLDRANREVLEATWSRQSVSSSGAMLFLILSGLLLGGTLLAIQSFLARRMRRMVNPILFCATLLTFIFVVYTASAFRAADRDLTRAKEGSFEPVSALWQARAAAYSANADESRYLLDPSRAAASEQAFRTKADEVENHDLAALSGDRESAVETLERFKAYRAIDGKIRQLETSGQHAAAIALCTGNAPGQSDWAFSRFDQELDQILSANERSFDAAVAQGFEDVNGFDISAPLIALSIAALAFLGLLPRIREYA